MPPEQRFKAQRVWRRYVTDPPVAVCLLVVSLIFLGAGTAFGTAVGSRHDRTVMGSLLGAAGVVVAYGLVGGMIYRCTRHGDRNDVWLPRRPGDPACVAFQFPIRDQWLTVWHLRAEQARAAARWDRRHEHKLIEEVAVRPSTYCGDRGRPTLFLRSGKQWHEIGIFSRQDELVDALRAHLRRANTFTVTSRCVPPPPRNVLMEPSPLAVIDDTYVLTDSSSSGSFTESAHA